jgi:cytochrome-b5 reductase
LTSGSGVAGHGQHVPRFANLISLVSQNGKMSQHINHLKPGETLSFKGPIAKYVYKPNEFAHGFAIGGGSGITMYQMITHSLELPGDNTKWTLMFANVTEKDICKL